MSGPDVLLFVSCASLLFFDFYTSHSPAARVFVFVIWMLLFFFSFVHYPLFVVETLSLTLVVSLLAFDAACSASFGYVQTVSCSRRSAIFGASS